MINTFSSTFSAVGAILTSALLQEGPAQTSSYFIAGYVVIFGTMALYLITLIVRSRNLRLDMEALNQMEENPH